MTDDNFLKWAFISPPDITFKVINVRHKVMNITFKVMNVRYKVINITFKVMNVTFKVFVEMKIKKAAPSNRSGFSQHSVISFDVAR